MTSDFNLLYDRCVCGHRLLNHSDIDELHSCNKPRCYYGKFTRNSKMRQSSEDSER